MILCLIFISCKNESSKSGSKSYSTQIVTKTNSDPGEQKRIKCDSINLTSDAFEINDMKCQWNFIATSYNGKDGEGKMILVNQGTNKILLADEDYYEDICHGIDFEDITKNNFKDANFDGYKDYVAFNRTGSGSGGEMYNIYLFDKSRGIFKISALSGAYPTFDSINRTLRTTWRSGAYSYSEITTYFDTKGSIKYTIIYQEEPLAEDVKIQTIKKIINGKIVHTKVDTLDKKDY